MHNAGPTTTYSPVCGWPGYGSDGEGSEEYGNKETPLSEDTTKSDSIIICFERLV